MESEVPSFEEFLQDEPDAEIQLPEEDESCAEVKLYFQPRIVPGTQQIIPPDKKSNPNVQKTDIPLYSPLPPIFRY